jgi:exonuclease SbcD
LSDIHIGVETYGRPATEDDLDALPASFAPGVRRHTTYLGLSTRLLDFLSALDRVVEFATREQVDLVLFAGDAYRSRDPSQTHQREFARRVATLASRGIPVFLLTGNHDLPAAPGRATALDIFTTLQVPLVQTADLLTTYVVETRAGPLQVVALPWARRGGMLSRQGPRGMTIEDLTRQMEQELGDRVRAEAEGLDPKVPAVLVAHATVAGAVTSSERSMMLGRDYVLQRSDVALPAFDYVALGHIHKHQVLGERPPVVYSGSLQRVDFSEEDDVKGFCLVEIDAALPRGERATWEFVPVDARPFLTIEVKVPADADDPTALVLRAIARRNVAGAVVRVHIQAPAEAATRLNDRAVRGALHEAHAIAAITREVRQERRTRLSQGAQGIEPKEALRLYLEGRQGVTEPARRWALQSGFELIDEERDGE